MNRKINKFNKLYPFFNNFSEGKYLIFIDSIIFTFSVIFALKVYTDIRGIYFFDFKYLSAIWIVANIIIFKLIGVYKERIRFASNRIFYLILLSNVFSLFLLLIINYFLKYQITFEFLFLLFLNQSFLLLFTRTISRSIYFIFNKMKSLNFHKMRNIIIYGAGDTGASLAYNLMRNNVYEIKFFVDDNKKLWGREIYGYKIYSPKEIKNQLHSIDKILIAIPTLNKKQKKYIAEELIDLDLEIVKVPSIDELNNSIYSNKLKDISTEELLMRKAVSPDINLIKKGIEGKNICVTGAGGSIGSELCKKILLQKPNSLVMIDHSETKIYDLSNIVSSDLKKTKTKFILGNACDSHLLESTFKEFDIDTVFHAAAYKHVPIVEMNPLRGIENNSLSTNIICQSCIKANVKKMVLISTDKAVRPTNVMGASKRLAELIMQGYSKQFPNFNFSLVRFGNVLGSSGSVVPLFERQIKSGGPITLTDNEIIRYFMTISEAAELVIQSAALAKGGEVFLLDMGSPIKIRDLAERMIYLNDLSVKDDSNPEGDIEIVITGLRPGEKLFEELLIDSSSKSTDHKLIYRANEKSLPFNKINKIISDLQDAVSSSNEPLALKLLAKAVPEWTRK